jgi:hypothetical protein
MKTKKTGPASRIAKGQNLITNTSYLKNSSMSMAIQIILLALQIPNDADRLRRACYDRLDQVLRKHYTDGRAGA